jgi:hypothetical protein
MDEIVQTKYANLTSKFTDFDFGYNTIKLETSIFKELLNIDEENAIEVFEELCRAFSEICYEYQIKFAPIDVFIFVDKGLERGASTKCKDPYDERLFAKVLIPAGDFTMHNYWKYTFLHELGHSWFSVDLSPEDMELGYEDLFIDLVVLCTFRKILPQDKRVYKEVRKHRRYFLTQQTKRFIGKELYRQILLNPEAYLKDLQQKIYPANMAAANALV